METISAIIRMVSSVFEAENIRFSLDALGAVN
jgi:hypothetical protein